MSNANIGWLFYKDYFNDLDYTDLSNNANEISINKKVAHIVGQQFRETHDEILGSTRFQATTTYPGLILGSGNAHEVPDVKGQAILGFHFDYTSGLPVIQGSSIKGVLRSAFKHPEYIKMLLDDNSKDIAEIEKEIFDFGDTFFDANIIKGDIHNRILGDDYITPHKDPLKDPIPLRFVKVLPDVTFLFEFDLADGSLNKLEKESLFKKILADLGLGAKTNVGYGKFIEFKKAPRTPEEEAQDKIDAANRVKAEREKIEADAEAHREAKRQAEQDKKDRLKKAEQDKLEAAQKIKKDLASHGLAEAIKDKVKYKALESVVKKYTEVKALDEAEKAILEEHILNNMKDKIKRKKFPFAAFNNDKCLGRERTEEIVDKLNLK